MILLIDNYDSFVFNLARYFQRLGLETRVERNDAITVDDIRELSPAAIVLSPGPGTPEQAGICKELVYQLHTEYPILGICLGHQAIAAALGGKVIRAAQPMHGRTSQVWHNGSPLFSEVPLSFVACRYHSLIVANESLPDEFVITAHCEDETIMAIEHSGFPVAGLQFHPESILSSFGFRILFNFLNLAGVKLDADCSDLQQSELQQKQNKLAEVPDHPVTF